MKKLNFNIKFNLKIGIFTFTSLFFLYLLYLSIPSLFDTGRVQKALYKNLNKDFGLNLSLSSDITYRILPQPHFHIKDSKIYHTKSDVSNEIGEAKDLKIFVSQKNFFNKNNIKINKIIFSKVNLFLKRENISFIKNFIKNEFSEKKIFIKNSKLFFNDRDENTVFIYSIKNLDLFKNKKENIQKISTNGELFKVPIKFQWLKNLENNNTMSNFKARKIDISFTNKGNFINGKYEYENNLNISTNNFRTIYKINKDHIDFSSKKSLIKNTPISFKGKIDTSPFSFELQINAKDIDINYLLKNTSLLNEILISEIFLNKNVNGVINIKTDDLYNNKIFKNAGIFFNFEEGEINLNNSFLLNKKFAKLELKNSNFIKKDDRVLLIGQLYLDIYDENQIYKIFPISKKKKFKKKLNGINIDFTLDLFSSKILIDKINFLDEKKNILQSKKIDDFVEGNFETLFEFSNYILFKNFMKKVLSIHLDEG